MTAAIIGGRSKTCQTIICDFKYRPNKDEKWNDAADDDTKFKRQQEINKMLKVFGKDSNDNNILHHTYINMMPDVREMLLGRFINQDQIKKTKDDINKSTKKIEKQKELNGFRMNRRGRKPSRMRHFLKAENSFSSESEDE